MLLSNTHSSKKEGKVLGASDSTELSHTTRLSQCAAGGLFVWHRSEKTVATSLPHPLRETWFVMWSTVLQRDRLSVCVFQITKKIMKGKKIMWTDCELFKAYTMSGNLELTGSSKVWHKTPLNNGLSCFEIQFRGIISLLFLYITGHLSRGIFCGASGYVRHCE